MKRHTVKTILGFVLALGGLTKAGLAQTPSVIVTPASGEGQSAAVAAAQEATNPFASSWQLQLQQNNNWTEMPVGGQTRMQSDLLFQPLLSMRLSEDQGLIIRPVVTVVNSVPHPGDNGQNERTAGFGDTVLAFALPHEFLGGRLMLGAGPTFILPTASKGILGQDNWQGGPDMGGALLGRHFITYAFAQQWFKMGGDGRSTNQMNGVFNFTYLFDNGWTLGTQPNLAVDWKASEGERATFPIGPQIGKMCKCGGIPTLIQVQAQYYAIRPNIGGPKWNFQLQVTPTIPALIRRALF